MSQKALKVNVVMMNVHLMVVPLMNHPVIRIPYENYNYHDNQMLMMFVKQNPMNQHVLVVVPVPVMMYVA